MIELSGVTYTYPSAAAPALRGVSLSIPDGQFCAIVGANGAGKSTLAYALAGYVPHFYRGELSGRVVVAGRDTALTPLAELTQLVGLVFQNPFNQISGARYTIWEEVAFGPENLGLPPDEIRARVAAALALTGIAALADRSPLSLSGGQMQRVALAAIVAMRPRLLVLDEPTAQLDPAGARGVLAAIRDLAAGGQTVVLIEHRLEWVAHFADRVIALADGEVIADGPPRAALTDPVLAARGLGQTRYTQAARVAREVQAWPEAQPLPVTLEQAVEGFRVGHPD